MGAEKRQRPFEKLLDRSEKVCFEGFCFRARHEIESVEYAVIDMQLGRHARMNQTLRIVDASLATTSMLPTAVNAGAARFERSCVRAAAREGKLSRDASFKRGPYLSQVGQRQNKFSGVNIGWRAIGANQAVV